MSRNEVLNAVWGRLVIVSSRSVDRCVTTLRTNVERDPRVPKHIITIRDIGYRFEPCDGEYKFGEDAVAIKPRVRRASGGPSPPPTLSGTFARGDSPQTCAGDAPKRPPIINASGVAARRLERRQVPPLAGGILRCPDLKVIVLIRYRTSRQKLPAHDYTKAMSVSAIGHLEDDIASLPVRVERRAAVIDHVWAHAVNDNTLIGAFKLHEPVIKRIGRQ